MIATALSLSIGPSTRAQPIPFDAAYKGALECEQAGIGLRGSLTITVIEGRVLALILMLDSDGRPAPVPGVMAAGILLPDGAFRFGYEVYTRDDEIRGHYTGTLDATSGTLTGSEVHRGAAGDEITRDCKGTFFQIALPRR